MRRLKSEKFNQMNEGRRDGKIDPLRFKHLVEILKGAHDKSFTLQQNLRGWSLEGIIPFTRHQYWKLRHANEMKSKARSSTGSCQSSGLHAGMSIAQMLNFESQHEESHASDSARISVEATASADPPVKVPDDVRDAIMRAQALQTQTQLATVPLGSTLQEAFISEHMEVRSLLKIITDWSKPYLSGTSDDPDDGDIDLVEDEEGGARQGRLNLKASQLWHRSFSATGEDVIGLARRQAQEKKRKAEEDKAKKDAKERKTRERATALLQTGWNALESVRRGGARALERLQKEALIGIIQFCNPQGDIAKGSKAELLDRARSLEAVAQALASFQANHPPAQVAPQVAPLAS